MPSKREKISGNPIDGSEDLQEMVQKLDGIQTKKKFTRWKSSFLAKFEGYLEEEGIDKATECHEKFKSVTAKFVKVTKKVSDAVENGTLTEEKVTVKGRNAMNEWNKFLATEVEEMDIFIPYTGAEEKKVGYNKYQMGAILVRDSFSLYTDMIHCRDTAIILKNGPIGAIADKQIIEAIDYYCTKFKNFCDLMADLQLYDIMLKCHQFSGDDDEGDGPFIFIDTETGAIGKLDREKVIAKGLITVEVDKTGEEIVKEAINDAAGKEKFKQYIKTVLG